MKKRILIFFSSLLSFALIVFAVTPNKNKKFFDFFKNPLGNQSEEKKVLNGGSSSSGGSFASGGDIVTGNANYSLIQHAPSLNMEFIKKNERDPNFVNHKLSSWFDEYISHMKKKSKRIESSFLVCEQSLSSSLQSYKQLYYDVIRDFDDLFKGEKSFSSSELDFKIAQLLSYYFIFEVYKNNYDENIIAFFTKLIWNESVGFILFETSSPMPLTNHFVYEANGQPHLFKSYQRILSNFLSNYNPQIDYNQDKNFKFEHCVDSDFSPPSL